MKYRITTADKAAEDAPVEIFLQVSSSYCGGVAIMVRSQGVSAPLCLAWITADGTLIRSHTAATSGFQTDSTGRIKLSE